MFDGIRQNWRTFITSEPGRRFEQRYRHSRQGERGRAKRLGWFLVGVVLVAVGLFFLVAPGPGVLFLLPGAALLSQESLALARLLDRGEIWLRTKLRRTKGQR